MSNNQQKLSASNVPFPQQGAVAPDRPCPELPKNWSNLASAFTAQVDRNPDKLLVADSTGQRLTYRDALVRASALALALRGKLGDQEYCGIMLPPSVAGTVANLAVTLLGKIPVNLNYALDESVALSAIRQCRINNVLSSRRVMEKSGFSLSPAAVLELEEIASGITVTQKGLAWLIANLAPQALRAHLLPGLRSSLSSTATVMFTSGSTGDSKGVVLSHANILYNIAQMKAHARLSEDEVLLGKLPYFHSYGFTGTLWAVACLGMSCVCHHNPLDPRTLGKLIQEHRVSVMASTPTLVRSSLKRWSKEQFASVHWLQLGSEKLKPELARDIRQTLGVEPVEGYGATEMSPGVSSCIEKDVSTPSGSQVSGNRPGSVGQPFPGTAVAVVDLQTGEILPRGRQNEGVLFFSGPQVMIQYLGKPAETAGVLGNGWYMSGDIGAMDDDGFLYITDRLSRFAKIGGEMVPIILVEAKIREIAGCDELSVAIAAVPDHSKGEKLVVMYTADALEPARIVSALQASGINNLWIPKATDFHQVDSFPTAATGKLDLKTIKQMALELDRSRS